MKLYVERVITILKIKLVTKQITYFCGAIQSDITTEQVSETGKKRVSSKTTGYLTRNSAFSLTTEKRVILFQGKLTKTIAPSTVNQDYNQMLIS